MIVHISEAMLSHFQHKLGLFILPGFQSNKNTSEAGLTIQKGKSLASIFFEFGILLNIATLKSKTILGPTAEFDERFKCPVVTSNKLPYSVQRARVQITITAIILGIIFSLSPLPRFVLCLITSS